MTGLPKPIYLTVGGVNTLRAIGSLEPEGNLEQASKPFIADRQPILAAVPFFHAMGLLVIARSIMCRAPMIRVPTTSVLNASLVIEVIRQTEPGTGIFPPSILEDLSNTPEGLEALKKLQYVFFGGAPLTRVSGEKICQVTTLVPVFGSTEAGMYANLIPSSREDWCYFQWSSAAGVVMEPAEEGLYEMTIKRKDLQYQGIFHTFPDLAEWRTKDLFEQHPSNQNLWRYKGRRDDIIVLSNGEKFNPVSTEKVIEGHPLVKGALVVGQGKFQAGLIIEPDWAVVATEDVGKLIDNIWPFVEKANTEVPAHARIYKSKLAIAKIEKPFIRAAKGSIIRLKTVALYQDEIEALFAEEDFAAELESFSIDDVTPEGLREFVRHAMLLRLASFREETSDDVDVFNLGADSLDVLALTSTLNHGLRAAGTSNITISARVIYDNPTVSKLAMALSSLLLQSEGSERNETRGQILAQMVEKYTADIHTSGRLRPKLAPIPAVGKHVVVLTGSTGSLGNYTLEYLVANPLVEHIYAMNRSADADIRQRAAFKERNAAVDSLDSKVTFLQTDFSKERFGLANDVYSNLIATTTIFIHNAWSVDFNKSLDSYEETHIAGTRRIVDFAEAARYKPKILFISSIASVGNWSGKHGNSPVPETIETVLDNTLPLQQGYAESKHVASQILAIASKRLGLRAAVVRAGQLAGPSEEQEHGSVWNKHEWLPSLVSSSKALRKIPTTLGNQDRVDWVPMDKAARVVADLALGALPRLGDDDSTKTADISRENCEVFHVVNPRSTSWSKLYPVIQTFYKDTEEVTIEAVDYATWIAGLEALPRTKENAEQVAGLKLIEFYESLAPHSGASGLPSLETTRTESLSPTLQQLGEVNEALMRKWLPQWMF